MMMMIMMMIMTMAMERISSFLFSRELVRQQNGVDESLRGKGLTRRFPARLCARLWRRCVHCRFLCLGQPADVKEDGLRHRGNVGSVWTLFAVTPTYIAAPEAAYLWISKLKMTTEGADSPSAWSLP